MQYTHMINISKLSFLSFIIFVMIMCNDLSNLIMSILFRLQNNLSQKPSKILSCQFILLVHSLICRVFRKKVQLFHKK